MSTLNKWIRIIHRWLAIPLLIAVVYTIVYTATQGPGAQPPNIMAGLGIVSLVSLILTGTYMFAQHYLAKWRRASRGKKRAAAAGGVEDSPLA